MKKKLVLSLMAATLLVTLMAAALAKSPYEGFPYLRGSNAGCCEWATQPTGGNKKPWFHQSDCCEYCGWGMATTQTVTTVSSMATVKTATGQRLIVRDKASFSGKVIGYLKCGTQVCVQSDHGKFALILCECGGKTVSGFVWKKDLRNMETITYTYEVEAPQLKPN